jgi:Zn-dependent protease with chaperone function
MMLEPVIAAHYDGRTATRHTVRIEPMADGFRLSGEGVEGGTWAWSELVALDGTGGKSVYGLKGVQGWRLMFEGPPPERFAAHLPLPARYGRWIDRFGFTRAAIGLAAISAVVVFLTLQAPAWLAPLIPRSAENRLGDALIGDMGGKPCRTVAGRAALDRLAAELGAKDAGVRSIEVAKIGAINAVALPGGRVLIFQGLLDQAKSADEVAGVLAHEIGHIEHRDTLAAMIRQLGLSVVLSGLSGQASNLANGMLALNYTRKAERAADAFAIDALRRSAIKPDATAAFFDRLGGSAQAHKAEQAMGWLASHPASAERKAAFLASKVPGKAYRPALDDAEWGALKGMCAADRTAKAPVGMGF